MKKVFILDELDCANCAAKMEDSIRKLDGVESANINFITQKLTIEIEDNKFDDTMKKVAKACKKVEPSCHIQL